MCECLHSGDNVAGAPDRVQVGAHIGSIPCVSLTTWWWVLIDKARGWDVLAFPNMAHIC